MDIIDNIFFARDASLVAREILGRILCHCVNGVWRKARIIETEAYYIHEKGSHASLGYTEKRRALFMSAGTIYMYYARGKDSFNVSCEGEGNAVLIKSGTAEGLNPPEVICAMQADNPVVSAKGKYLRPVEKLCAGQTLLCKSLGLKVAEWDGRTFHPHRLFFCSDGYVPEKVIIAKRLGIPKGRDENLLLRFIDQKYKRYSTRG